MAYAWIWDTLSSRGYWSGMVKDFCKRGDHNWVEANVYPQVDADSHICNYHFHAPQPAWAQIAVTEVLHVQLC